MLTGYRYSKMRLLTRLALLTGLVLGLASLLASGLQWHNHWQRVERSGTLTIAIREAEGVFWPGDQGYTGLEHDLAQLLGQRLNLEIQLFSVQENSSLYRALASGAVDIALPGISQNPEHSSFKLGQPYLMTHLGLARTMARQQPELTNQRIGLSDPDSQREHSTLLMSEHPGLTLSSQGHPTTTELMTRIELDELDMALVDHREYLVQRPFFPDQRFDALSNYPRPIAPLFRQQTDISLMIEVNSVIKALEQEGLLARLTDRYLGHTHEFDYVGILTFERHMESRLPQYRGYFEEQASETGLDWRLLAAVAYQESHWRANAVSPTGVRGLMMVTQRTAREMGISNRIDPAQSISAGSRYLSQLKNRIPERIEDPDRTWFALAAYNVGMGHLEDARILTTRLGDDPDSWIAVRAHLPKLALQDWYPQTRFGYARGHEPVVYVDNIRRYYNTLLRVFPALDESTASNEGLDGLPMPALPVGPL